MERGLLIAFEGVDFCGKDTQVEELAKRFILEGEEVVTIDFPSYDTPSGQAIKAILDDVHPLSAKDNPIEVQALYVINRYEQQARIETALMRGKVVICNRYLHSAVVYGTFSGLDDKWFYDIQHSLVQPDLVVLLDIDYREYLNRSERLTDLDAFETNNKAIQHAIIKYQQLAEENQWVRVDGKGEINEIADLVFSRIQAHLK